MSGGNFPPFAAVGDAVRRRNVFLVLLCLAVAWTAIAWPWLSGTVTIPYDAKAHFHAQLQFLATALHSGQSPFWTPNVFAGSPQVADPQSLIFSPAILVALLDPTPSFRMVDGYVLALLLMGGASISAFGLSRGWHPAAAVLAGLAFAFGGSAYWRIQHVGQIQSYAFLGLSIWLFARSLDRPSLVNGLIAGVSVGFMIATPDQVAYLGLFVLTGIAIDRMVALRGDRAALLGLWRPLLGGTLGTIAIAALPLLMTVLFAAASNRAEIELSEAVTGSLHWGSLLTFLLGDIFGAADPKVPYWGPSSQAWTAETLYLAQNMTQLYAGGLVALLVVAIAFAQGVAWRRDLRVFTLLAILFLLYALGRYTPVFGVLFDYLPGAAAFRRPADATFLIGAMAAILAGGALDALVKGEVRRPRAALAGGVAVAAALCAGLLAAWYADRVTVALPALGQGVLVLAASLGVLVVLAALGRARPMMATALVALVATADFAVHHAPNESTGLPPARYEVMRPDTNNETIALLRQRLAQGGDDRRWRVELVGIGFDWPNLGLVHGFDHSLGYNPLRLDAYAEATGAQDTLVGPFDRVFTPLFPSYRCRLVDLLGIRYLVSKVPMEMIDPTLRPGELNLVAQTRDGFVYENPNALPRVFAVTQHRVVDFAEIIETGRWPMFEPRATVLLESEPEPLDRSATTPSVPVPLDPPRARLVSYTNTEVVVEVTSAVPAFAVLNDVWHPWWRATVDGEEADILKANVLFRAVRVPAGRSVVVFTFAPVSGALAELQERLFAEAEQ